MHDGYSVNMKEQGKYMTNYTACFHVVLGDVSLSRLNEECRIMVGVDAENIEHHDDTTNFTLTTEVDEDEVEPEEYFTEICLDLSRWLGVAVTLDEIFVDD